MIGEEWREYALCSGVGPDLFFSVDLADFAVARGVCSECPVRMECLDFALTTNQEGTWGGTNDNNRRSLRRCLKQNGPAAYLDAVDRLFNPPDPALAPATPERPCPRCDSIIPARPAGDPYPEDTNSPGADCTKPVTYNRGCRCLVCLATKSKYNADRSSPRGEPAKLAEVHPIDSRRTA